MFSTNNSWDFRTDGTSGLSIDPWGRVGIGFGGQYAGGGFGENLHVNGNGLFTGNVTAACGVLTCSDKRYKKDFNKIGSALDMISQVDGYTYNFRTTEFQNLNFDSTQQVGFIAQELQEVLPEAVHEDKSGYLSVDYGKVTPLLLMAIKEQQAIIEDLKKENAELKAEASTATSTSEANAEKLAELQAQMNTLMQLLNQDITAEK